MSIKFDEKMENLKDNLDLSNDVGELNQLRDHLYEKMNGLASKISDKSENLTEFYQSNVKQKRSPYLESDNKVYIQAKDVDALVNEYSNTQILIELIEKKIEKIDNKAH